MVEGARVYLRVPPPTSMFFFGPPAVSDRNGEFALIVPGDPVLKLTARPSQGDRWIDVVIPGPQSK